MKTPQVPSRGDVWLADLDPIRGHEQGGRRPVLVVSETLFNRGPAGLVIVVPITSRIRPILSHIRLQPPEGGLKVVSSIMSENVRSVSRNRLMHRFGRVGALTMLKVEDVLKILMGL